MVIVVGGMIGLGKTTVSELIADHFKSEVFYESVSDNPILEKFYTSSKEDQEKYRYPFLLQLYFLDSRFKSIKKALVSRRNVLDRSIYEDWYFAKVNNELGRISDLEFSLYSSLLDNMMEELKEIPKKSPDLMIYLTASFETVIERISQRGRSFEDDSQREYFYKLWKGYDEWVSRHYNFSQVLVVNMDKIDVVRNEEDRRWLIESVESMLK